MILLIIFKVVSTPDLQIIDYAVGLPGSQHDATAFSDTHIAKDHNILLDNEEFYGVILPTLCISGVKHLIKSKS